MGKDEPCAEGSLLILLLAIASCPLPNSEAFLAEKKAQEKGHRTMFSSLGPNIGSSTLFEAWFQIQMIFQICVFKVLTVLLEKIQVY